MLDELLQQVPPHLHKEYLGLVANIPDYVKKTAVVGPGCPVLGHLLKKRPGAWTAGVTDAPKPAALAAEILDDVFSGAAAVGRLPDGGLDALVLCDFEDGAVGVSHWLECLAPKLHTHGQIYALYTRPAEAADPGAELAAGLVSAGFSVYQRWPLSDPEAGGMLVAVSTHYNPVLHARTLREAGAFEAGYAVLDKIPSVYRESAAAREAIDLEKLDTLSAWILRDRGRDVSHLLSRALTAFYLRVDENPRDVAAWQRMAVCWEHAGDPGMARRLLGSIQYAAPHPATVAQLDRLSATSTPVAPDLAPPRGPTGRIRRVLYLIHPRPHFGLDGLYDGLCAALGDENVVEFPWKPTLHGDDTGAHANYPCRYNRAGPPATVEQVTADLQRGRFDAILFGDVEGDIPGDAVQAILGARGTVPVFLVDALDQPCNFRPLVQQRIGMAAFAGYFKREMLRCTDYGPGVFPMPFSYGVRDSVAPAGAPRPHDFFWAGHRVFGQRRLYLETLEARYGWDLERQFDQETYRRRLLESRIGLNCFGLGFDTVRYWELPAHGCMLLSDRLPIRIPANFEDGVHAVFFDGLPDLLEKLDYYLAHAEESARIAAAGHRHFLAHHTNEARARQVLGWMAACMGE